MSTAYSICAEAAGGSGTENSLLFIRLCKRTCPTVMLDCCRKKSAGEEAPKKLTRQELRTQV
jgi:hypothetical protein